MGESTAAVSCGGAQGGEPGEGLKGVVVVVVLWDKMGSRWMGEDENYGGGGAEFGGAQGTVEEGVWRAWGCGVGRRRFVWPRW